MTKGTLYLSYNNEDFTVKAGEYLLLPPCNAWRQGFKPAYSEFYWLHFSVERLVILMKQLQDMAKSKYPAIALDSMSTAIITALYGQLMLLPPVENQTHMQKQIYNDIIDFINTNINKNLKISEIAEAFGYNEKYLSHKFAELTGTPLKHYIMKTKIDSANFMLSDTNKSISEIAQELGFSDNHNFSRAYKNSTGMTPSEYRNAFNKRLLFHK